MSTVVVEVETIRVGRWADPVVDGLGHPVDSPYVEWFWLPVLGPSALWLARRLVHAEGQVMPVEELGRAVGLQSAGGRNAPVRRALGRLVGFDVARLVGDEFQLRHFFAPLPARKLARLPEFLQALHEVTVR